MKDLVALRIAGLGALRRLEFAELRRAAHIYNGGLSHDSPATIEVLLRASVDRLDEGSYGRAASKMYGLAAGTRAASPKIRRELAAAELGIMTETFRKSRELQIRDDVASQILQILIERQEHRLFVSETYPSADVAAAESGTPLDLKVQAAIFNGLLEQFVSGAGFRSQRFDEDAFSLASTGACAHAICTAGAPDLTRRRILRFICDAIRDDGRLPTHTYGGEIIETTWAAAQCLLALTTAPSIVDTSKAAGLAQTLLRRQSEVGWSLRRRDGMRFEPLISFYPLLALLRAAAHGWIEQDELEAALIRVQGPLKETLDDAAGHPARRLLAEYQDHLVSRALKSSTLVAALSPGRAGRIELSDPDSYAQLGNYTVTASAQPLWYAKLWRPALYLITRHLYPLPAPISVLLGAELVDTFSDAGCGWNPREPSSRENELAYTWTTALGLRTARALRNDLDHLGLDAARLRQLAADARRTAWR